jgi:hypothetical protein
MAGKLAQRLARHCDVICGGVRAGIPGGSSTASGSPVPVVSPVPL